MTAGDCPVPEVGIALCMWEPIGQAEVEKIIEMAELVMEPSIRLFWDRIKIRPAKWQLSPWGDTGGGFWVVALAGNQCVYYNDIEEGFNISQYDEYGRIREYWCDQHDLSICISNYCATFFPQPE